MKHPDNPPFGGITLILGGARSGKSRFAMQLAARSTGPVVSLATGSAGDAEMADRIARHRRERPAAWRTIEQSRALGTALRTVAAGTTVLLDSLGDLATDYLLERERLSPDLSAADLAAIEAALDTELDDLIRARAEASVDLIVVSNEVGLGLAPPYPLGRHYRDILGRANQRLAADADPVYWLVAGIPVNLRALPDG